MSADPVGDEVRRLRAEVQELRCEVRRPRTGLPWLSGSPLPFGPVRATTLLRGVSATVTALFLLVAWEFGVLSWWVRTLIG